MSVPYFPPDEIRIEGMDALTRYRWGDHMVNHWLCATCGVSAFHDAIATPGHYRVNLGCVDEIDTRALEIEWVDGRSF